MNKINISLNLTEDHGGMFILVAEVILPDNATVAWRLPGAVGHQSGANSATGKSC